MDWASLFQFSVSPLEIVVRGTLMYWFIFVIFAFVLRRDVGSVGISDVLVLVIIADAAQNAMAGGYQSITDGMVLVGTIVAWNYAFDWAAYHSRWFRNVMEPDPITLVMDGRLVHRNMRKELISTDELMGKIREQGIEDLNEVRRVYMERNGKISVIRKA